MMQLKVIGSSSSGNCYVLENETEALVIECGCPLRDLKRMMHYEMSKIVGCIISHEHNDHAGYAQEYSQSCIHIYALQDVLDKKNIVRRSHAINEGETIHMGSFTVKPFNVKHDVPCLGFQIDHDECGRILFLTDTYSCPINCVGINHWLIEANYADSILDENIKNGSVSPSMRKRLLLSHMEIDNTIQVLKRSELANTRNIVLIHLSSRNSDEQYFIDKVQSATGKATYVADSGMNIQLKR